MDEKTVSKGDETAEFEDEVVETIDAGDENDSMNVMNVMNV